MKLTHDGIGRFQVSVRFFLEVRDVWTISKRPSTLHWKKTKWSNKFQKIPTENILISSRIQQQCYAFHFEKTTSKRWLNSKRVEGFFLRTRILLRMWKARSTAEQTLLKQKYIIQCHCWKMQVSYFRKKLQEVTPKPTDQLGIKKLRRGDEWDLIRATWPTKSGPSPQHPKSFFLHNIFVPPPHSPFRSDEYSASFMGHKRSIDSEAANFWLKISSRNPRVLIHCIWKWSLNFMQLLLKQSKLVHSCSEYFFKLALLNKTGSIINNPYNPYNSYNNPFRIDRCVVRGCVT